MDLPPLFLFYVCGNWDPRGYRRCLQWKSQEGTDPGAQMRLSTREAYPSWATPAPMAAETLNRSQWCEQPQKFGFFVTPGSSPGGSGGKNPPATQETRARFLGQENSLEKGMTTHSSILAWRIPWTEEPGRLLSMGSQRIGHNWTTSTFFFSLLIKLEHMPGHSTFLTLVKGHDDCVVVSTERAPFCTMMNYKTWSF